MKNTGKDFELITQKIYQALLDYDSEDKSFRKNTVQHNVVLEGKSGNTHQIDVYFEFELAGLVYKTIIEVKDWKSPVQQTILHSFKAVIDDIPGTVKGIFVSRSGFQSGAKVYAASQGIELIQLSKESDDTKISIMNSSTTTHYVMTAVSVDELWCEEQSIPMSEVEHIIPEVALEDTYLVNPRGEKVSLFKLMCMDAVPFYTAPEGERHAIERTLYGEWYWVSDDSTQKIKVKAYSFECYNTCVFSMLYLTIPNFPTYCITNVFSKEQQRYYLSPQKTAIRLQGCRRLPTVYL